MYRKISTKHGIAGSQLLQVPNVFVVPPEEDEAPIWCCFDATQAAEDQTQYSEDLISEMQYLGPTSVYMDEDVPFFHRNSGAVDTMVMPRRSGETRSIVEALMSSDYKDDHSGSDSDSELDWDLERDEHPQSPGTVRDPAEDSDVIEVVKVSRRSEESRVLQPAPSPQTLKRSATFKARASKAFRSLTGSLRSSKPRVQDIFPSRPSSRSSYINQGEVGEAATQQPSPPPPSLSATVSRRRSAIFSQLFSPPSLKARNSISSFDDPLDRTICPAPTVALRSSQSSASMFSEAAPSHISQSSTRRSSIYQVGQPQAPHIRASSPNPINRSASNRRFSKLNLQKLFTFSSHSSQSHVLTPNTPNLDSGRTTPTLTRKSSSPLSTSSESTTSGPQTPTRNEDVQLVNKRHTVIFNDSPQLDFDEDFGLGLDLVVSIPLSQSKESTDLYLSGGASYVAREGISTKPPPRTPMKTLKRHRVDDSGLGLDGDGTSFEMRLDSLHFDSLSFDADEFNI